MPLPVLERAEDGSHIRRREHPLWRLLNKQANPEMTALELRRQQWTQFLLEGECYTHIEKDLAGRPVALWPLEADRMQIDGDIRPGVVRRFLYTHRDGTRQAFLRDELFVMSDLSLSGQRGESRFAEASESVGLSLATMRYAALFFARNGRPTMFLTHPTGFKTDDEEEEAIKLWNQRYSGPNAHGIGFLKKGLEPVDLKTQDNNAAQMVETRRFNKEQNAMLARMPPHLLQDLSRGTFSNISRQGVEYVTYALLSLLTLFEQASACQLFDPLEQERGLEVKHNVKALMRGDVDKQASFYTKMIQWRLMTVNEVRELEDLDRVEGGDVFLQPANMIAVDVDGEILPGQPALGAQSSPSETGELGERILGRLNEAEYLSSSQKDEVLELLEEHLGLAA